MTPTSPTTPNLGKTALQLLAALDTRSKDIMARRYGVTTGKPETLESIGREYGITRERVRQIQSQAKRAISELQELLTPVATIFTDVFTSHGGILTEDHIVAIVQDRLQSERPAATVVAFYLDMLNPYQYVSRHPSFGPHWRYPAAINPQADDVLKAARTLLKETKHPVTEQQLISDIRRELAATEATVPTAHILATLTASKYVDRTPFGEWGLTEWPETNPRGVGDKAYAVLRRHNRPEHFTKITELINTASFDHKRANPQTVHNELIKDERFVLVGRGLYGLTEWGYISGTVADVIESLLKDAGQPLTREEVIERVLAQRQVKKNTILLGLQNQKRFQRTPENRYTVTKRSA